MDPITGETGNQERAIMERGFHIVPVGITHINSGHTYIEIFEDYADALSGLEPFSHIIVLVWFHKSDTREKRGTLRVHPRRNRTLPLTGVFATRSPVRPNPVALYTCKVLAIRKNIIQIDGIDAFDGTPVIDIKPYIPAEDEVRDAAVAEWLDW